MSIDGRTAEGQGLTLTLDAGHSFGALTGDAFALGADASGVIAFDDGAGGEGSVSSEQIEWLNV